MLHYKVATLRVECPQVHLRQRDLARNKMGHIVLACIEADFEFWQDGACLLQVPSWNVGQLAMQLNAWLEAGLTAGFQFDCMDDESQDLFTFRHADSGFQFSSEWSKLTQAAYIEREELVQFIQTFSSDINVGVKDKLGIDASSLLGYTTL